jgi:hypothetical protein
VIEERVKDIFASQDAEKKIKDELDGIEKKRNEVFSALMTQRGMTACKKENLGKIIAPLTKNIIVQIDGKIYCVFFNRKYGTASILEGLSVKDAETQIAINKMQNGAAPNERDI